MPGFTAVEAKGHTPGHTAFQLAVGGKRLLLWGDLVHNANSQFAKPEITIEFDIDQKQAAATRKAIFKATANERELVAGAHLRFPGLGRVRSEDKGKCA